MIGKTLNHYKILEKIGAGGMGEVYKANDTRLDRIVAIKVLPAHLSGDPQIRERFEREARSISSLNHSNICTLHDIGSHEGVDFLVMEYLEGETLDARLENGPLTEQEILCYGLEIADALDKAHRQGLIHRDLKPGNVMLTKSGAKLLDFGLAKSAAPGSRPSDLTSSATIARSLTAEGTIVGTFQYMAPELLEGKEADARSDIFAFGAVLYEMATGKKAFEGTSQASLIAAILKEEPRPISQVAPMAPPALDRLVRTCLAKDPDERRQTMHDVLLELQWIRDGGSQAGIPAPVAARRKARAGTWMALAILFGLIAVALGLGYLPDNGPATRRVVASLLPPEDGAFSFTGQPAGPPVLSPDGSQLVYAALDSGGMQRLWLRPLDTDSAVPLPGTERGARPFWSHDGRFVAFFADGTTASTPTAANRSRSPAWN